ATRHARDRRHAGVADPARHDLVVRREGVAAVEREAVQRHAALDAHADRRDLLFARLAVDPHAGAALHLAGVDAVLAQQLDEHALEPAYVAHDLALRADAHDGVADELARPVPRDLAAAVDVDDGR